MPIEIEIAELDFGESDKGAKDRRGLCSSDCGSDK